MRADLGGGGTSIPACPTRHYSSKVEFRADLPDARIPSRGHLAHRVAEDAEIAVRVIELGVIEDVKELCAYFKGHRFRNSGPLHQTDIEIVDSGAVEELPIGVAERSHRS